MKVTLAESAVRDLERIVAHYKREKVPDVGADLVTRILDRIETLAEHPDMGRPAHVVPEFDNESLRELIEAPFRIVYRRETERIRVVRVWRSERQLKLPRDRI